MKTEILVALIALGGVVITILGTLAGTVLGTHLSRRSNIAAATELAALERIKYTHDRLWDARKETYASMIASLSAQVRQATYIYDGLHDPEQSPHEFYGSGDWGKANSALWQGWRTSQQEFDRGRLVFSDAFIARFEGLASDAMHEDDGLDPPDQSDVTMEVFKKAVSDLLAIARAEITSGQLATKASP